MALKSQITFGALLKWHRRKIERPRVWVAKQVGIDSSYLTIIEDKGFVPRREIAQKLGDLFGCPNKFLLAAGYAPQILADNLIRAGKEVEIEIYVESRKPVTMSLVAKEITPQTHS